MVAWARDSLLRRFRALQDGWAAIFAASLQGHVRVVDELLAANATVNASTQVLVPRRPTSLRPNRPRVFPSDAGYSCRC